MSALGGFVGEVGSWAQVILGVGLLVFIHEAGHFLVAKWAGVRVLAFSLGFGPEMFGFSRGPTRYRVSWIPLGGYVKMSGETELPEGGYAPDDYPAKPVWKRALIIVAGVAMNAVLGFALFLAALLVGIKVDPVVVGTVRHGGPAWEAGLRAGDRVLTSDGRRLVSFTDLVYATLDGEPLDLVVDREGATLHLRPVPRKEPGERAPAIGVNPDYGSVLRVPPGGSAEKAGFRDGDRVVAIGGVPAGISDLGEEVFAAAVLPAAGPLGVTVRRGGERVAIAVPPSGTARRIGISPLRTTVDFVRDGGPAARAGWRAGDRPAAVAGRPVAGSGSFLRSAMESPGGTVRVVRGGGEADLPLPEDPAVRLELLRDLRFAPAPSPTAVEVSPDGAAARAGLPSGARITSVAGAPVATFEDAARRIREAKEGAVALEWALGAETGRSSVVPAEVPLPGLAALDLSTEPASVVLRAGSAGEAVSLAADRCVVTTRQIVTTVAGIFRGSVDKSNLGGPILIAQVAHRSTEEGFGHFLWLLGMLSINLMFLNVLPIPVLDGGQLALLAVEGITRRRPSEALVGIAQMTGLVLLLALMVFISFNDVARLLR